MRTNRKNILLTIVGVFLSQLLVLGCYESKYDNGESEVVYEMPCALLGDGTCPTNSTKLIIKRRMGPTCKSVKSGLTGCKSTEISVVPIAEEYVCIKAANGQCTFVYSRTIALGVESVLGQIAYGSECSPEDPVE